MFGFTLLVACELPVSTIKTSDGWPKESGFADLQIIDAGLDLSPVAETPSKLGGPCTYDFHCENNLVCHTEFPGGFCTRPCEKDEQCDKQQACFNGKCHVRCNPVMIVDQCRDDYVCRVDGARAVCVPDCRVIGCESNWMCDEKSELCLDPAGGGFSTACGTNIGNCDGTPNGICLSMGDFFKPICSMPCAPFTRPCPLEIPNMSCAVGGETTNYCVILCHPQREECPFPWLECAQLSQGFYVCLPL
ncbi:MAG: hypothetical protein V1754_11780 [Pseudomonadota bacterium]